LNTDLVCDAIKRGDARAVFCRSSMGRHADCIFQKTDFPIGAGLEDLGKGLCSVTGTMYGTSEKGARLSSVG